MGNRHASPLAEILTVDKPSKNRLLIQWCGLFLGPALAIVCLMYLPSQFETAQSVGSVNGGDTTAEFSWAGRSTLAVMVWMGIWWLTEAIEISATALLPLVLFPLLGAADIKSAAFPYANHLIFLYFGGFVMALSMERWGLGKRIALLALRVIGTSAPNMVAGFMLVTAVLSAFVSNTATTAMMLPIAISTIGLLRTKPNTEPDAAAGDSLASTGVRSASTIENPQVDTHRDRFGTCLLLSIAYAASIGGVATIIGTPTNAFLIGFLRDNIAEEYRLDFSFAGWFPIGASLVIVFLPIMYVLLTRILFPIRDVQLEGGEQMIESEIRKLGPIRTGEWTTFAVFIATVLCWLTRPLLTQWEITWGDDVVRPLAGLTDTGIAMTASLALFLLPVNLAKREFTMDWKTVNKMPWGILLLFGGGLSLAAAVQANGVAEFIGSYASQAGDLPVFVTVLLVTSAIVFLTELTSNVATTTSLVPVLAAIAPGVGIHPYLLIIPATIAASCAFMLPVATPPNAIVFGSGEITLPQMVRAGFVLNLISLLLVTLLAFVVIRPWLGF